MLHLRDNQKDAVNVGVKHLLGNKPPSLIVGPPGWGKSVIIAHIAKQLKEGKLLVLQPSKELLAQNYEKFKKVGGVASVYSDSFGEKEFGRVVYATIGSIKSLGHVFRKLGFRRIIIDEADRFPRNENSMLDVFLKESEIDRILGLTASPYKLENSSTMHSAFSVTRMLTQGSKNSDNLFKNIIHITQIEEIIRDGWWAPLKYKVYNDISCDELKWNTSKSEYTQLSIDEFYGSQHISEKISDELSSLSDRKSILVFVPSVEEAISMSASTKNSAAVWGDMNNKERERIIKGFRDGEIRIVFNVNVLSVGFDHPALDCIILARPTASLSLYFQQVGRGVRLGKNYCLVIDLSGNVTRFGRIEHIHFEKDGRIWKCYGENNKLLTGIPIHELGLHIKGKPYTPPKRPISTMVWKFGKYEGRKLSEAPDYYLKWLMENRKFSKDELAVKSEIIRILSRDQ